MMKGTGNQANFQMASKTKRKLNENPSQVAFEDENFIRLASVGASDDDTTDSEESEYSGLESEDDSDDEEDSYEEFDEYHDSDDDSDDDEEEAGEGGGSDGGEGSSQQKKKDRQRTQKVLTAKEKRIQGLITKTNQIAESTISASRGPPAAADEYEVDSSDEEDIRNTVGNIPMEWYKEFDHIGYDLDGKKLGKPKGGDDIDEFLDKMDNPDYWRTVNDKLTGQKVVLSDKDVETIQRLKTGKYVDPNFDPYQPWVDFFTNTVLEHPVTNKPAPKSSFVPSKWERLQVGKYVHALKMGWMKPLDQRAKEIDEQDDKPRFYMLWDKENKAEDRRRQREIWPPPKMALPGHAESYNPPPEYLFTKEEKIAWEQKEAYERRVPVIPRKFESLRQVPAYRKFVKERFERCLDLYLCPRKRVVKMNIDPEDLIPKLPKPRDLMPFPVVQSLRFEGHEGFVRTISACPTGQWVASGSDDGTVRLWEVQTGRCMRTIPVATLLGTSKPRGGDDEEESKKMGVIRSVAWNPNPALSLLAVVVDKHVVVLNTRLGDKLVISNTDDMLATATASSSGGAEDEETSKKVPVTWSSFSAVEHDDAFATHGFRVKVSHPKVVTQVTWHGRGDYFATTLKDGGSVSVLIHQLSKRRSQNPFSKPKGLVQCVLFHPTRPFFFVATQRYVRMYNLLKQELAKKLLTNVKWVSSIAVHPGGDNVIIGSYDCRLSWFDLDLSTKPYKTLRHHKKAIRHVTYHRRYPLFASASDDGSVIVCHGQVYNDLLKNPLIVPVKVLRGHQTVSDLGVLCCEFHPTQPWLFTSGADNTIRLFT